MKNVQLTQPLLIRFARLEDAHALHTTCFPDRAYEDVEDYLRWCLEDDERPTRLVAWYDGKLAGHLELVPRQASQWAEISQFVSQEKEIARRMMRAAMRLAQRWGCQEVRCQLSVRAYTIIDDLQQWGFQTKGRPFGGKRWLVCAIPSLTPSEPPPPQVESYLFQGDHLQK